MGSFSVDVDDEPSFFIPILLTPNPARGPPAPKWDCDPVEEVEESEAEMAGGGIGEPAEPKEGTFPTTIFPDIAAISGLPMMFCLALLAPDAVFERFAVALAVAGVDVLADGLGHGGAQ